MSEYIERETALLSLTPIVKRASERNRNIRSAVNQCVDAINFVPAADVRPVVLCRDCRNSYEWANMDGDNYRYCSYLRSRWNHDVDRMVDDDDFCRWGAKREES